MTKAGLGLAVAALVVAAVGSVACQDNPPLLGAQDASADRGQVTDAGGPDVQAAGDSGADTGTPCTVNKPPSDQACASCVQASCCEAANGCLGNADCEGYAACIRKCPTPILDAGPDAVVAADGGGEGSAFACAKGCMKQFPNGVNAGIVLLDCEDKACPGTCN